MKLLREITDRASVVRDLLGRSVPALCAVLMTVQMGGVGVVLLWESVRPDRGADIYAAMGWVMPLWAWGIIAVTCAIAFIWRFGGYALARPGSASRLAIPTMGMIFVWTAICFAYGYQLGVSTALPMYGPAAWAAYVVLRRAQRPRWWYYPASRRRLGRRPGGGDRGGL